MSRFLIPLLLGVLLLISSCSPTTEGTTVVVQGTNQTPVPTLDPRYGSENANEIDQSGPSPVPTLNPQLVSKGEQVYGQYCASCHGANLEGQPEWQIPLPDGTYRAPPHDSTGHTWHHSDELLLEIIAEGSDPSLGGTMQGFADVLDTEDMVAVLEFIKSHWGEEERGMQWDISNR